MLALLGALEMGPLWGWGLWEGGAYIVVYLCFTFYSNNMDSLLIASVIKESLQIKLDENIKT